LRWVFYLVLIITVAIGWLGAGWLGAVIGLFTGFIAACASWCFGCYFAIRRFLRKWQWRMSQMTTAQLREIAMDLASPDWGFAVSELSRRGIVALPSLESVLDYLTSSDANQRGRALGALHALYPTVHARLPEGSSNLDTPGVWRERLRTMSAAGLLNVQRTALTDGGSVSGEV
jgi:hypothetical protein